MKPTYLMTRKERREAQNRTRQQQTNPATDSTPTTSAPEEPVAAPFPVAAENAKPTVSAAKIAANQANALHSTGPKSEAGKRASSHNAVKTALTGQTILLPTDDVASYQNLGREFVARHQPVGFEEESLVQCLIETEWRLLRIPSQESSILAVGRHLLADTVPDHLLEAEVYLKYERSLKNLHVHENRLRRYRATDLKSLQTLQTARQEREMLLKKAQQAQAKQQPSQPQPQQAEQPQPAVGFVFETTEQPLKMAV